jgi:3-methyladenine DNA glycosylase AlkC
VAGALKHHFSPAVVREIASDLRRVSPDFPARRFVADACAGLEELELMDRGRHVAAALARALPADFGAASRVLVASLGPELARTKDFGMAVFRYLPHTLYVAEHGLSHFEAAMAAQHALTRRFSAEFSIRAFLLREPERTLAVLRDWTRDPSEHVRRLVSEGTRPRLPWATRLPAFQRDPRPVLALLERLKDDPSEYVRRSVANNLNDIGKDHPDVLKDVAARWIRRAPPARRALVRHALRSLVKAGDRRALDVLGYGRATALRVTGGPAPRRVRIGEAARLRVEVANRGRAAVHVAVDLRVHFPRASGGSRVKVFKGASLRLSPGAAAAVEKSVRFAPRTTRAQLPGRHRVEALVNGRVVPLGHVDVRRVTP